MNKIIINSVIFAIILNVILSFFFTWTTSIKEKNIINKSENLDFKQQIAYIFINNQKYIYSSTLIIAFIVALSIGLSEKISIIK
jgi:hypothetical protein